MKTEFLAGFGHALWHLYQRSHLLQDAKNSLHSMRQAALLISGNPSARFSASGEWARISKALKLPALEAYTQCMELLPHIISLGAPVPRRYESITPEIQHLITEAAAAAITAGHYDLAVEWLEQGRCFVWNQLLQLRTPLDELRSAHPELAEELQKISFQLESASIPEPTKPSIPNNGLSLHETAQKHRRWAERREELIDSIRLLPGFEDFLRHSKLSKLVGCMREGTVVVLNVDNQRCDALVIQAGTQSVSHVLLGDLTYERAEMARSQLTNCLHARHLQRGIKKAERQFQGSFKNLLSILWHTIVRPVLAHLEIAQVLPVEELPHITWCVTGPLSFLPIHAAGDYDNPGTILSNLAISSYAPNLISLQKPTPAPSTFSGILAVGHESSIRGLSALPGTTAELDQVERHCEGLPVTRLYEKEALANTVLQAMADHSWVHFACHASQDPGDPLKSALHLHDEDLNLAAIYRTPFENAQLAFLSACQTATGDSALPDEAVHLAAGLLMAGYPSVIATMWSISDTDAPLVAGEVYKCLLEDHTPDSWKAAKALHRATARLRDEIGVEEFARWVPYIHIGH
ncbi:hypothetical protein FRC09_005249 [Ceratobasidium sp. 395]|nr:hypothetical protein FRC09_005249 [Ceratobasidium sp. 395]